MAKYTTGNGRKIILLLLLIIVVTGAGILLVDFIGSIYGLYFPIPGLKQIRQLTMKKKLKMAEDPYLLEREELSKDFERLQLKEEQLIVIQEELKGKENEISKKTNELKNMEKELSEKEKILQDRENIYNDRTNNIREQAVKLYNMPPKDAVSLLDKQTEADIVEILRAIDVYSEEIGSASTAPYLLKLLGDINKEKAGNVLRKLKYGVSGDDSAVDILDENEIKNEINNTEDIPMP